MKNVEVIESYSLLEERLNISSHGLGYILSVVALVLLVGHAAMYGDILHIVSFAVFGLSLMILYAASTIYHSAKDAASRERLRIFDHASIYILIAGTYTPFTIITLGGSTGWTIFGVSWGMALVGIVMKLFYTGRFDLFSTLMYIFMGWIILFALESLVESLSTEGLIWLVAGGVAYTVGAVLYSVDKIKLNHAAFHLLVLVGSFCHFISVFFYVLPVSGIR
ncbi:MAG: hemolysin III family protein [Gammaproteobacteria bacterium]|nr:hemolysin III family protein [Gammaproteobacteria bacterium]